MFTAAVQPEHPTQDMSLLIIKEYSASFIEEDNGKKQTAEGIGILLLAQPSQKSQKEYEGSKNNRKQNYMQKNNREYKRHQL
jgi:hypothetical protein